MATQTKSKPEDNLTFPPSGTGFALYGEAHKILQRGGQFRKLEKCTCSAPSYLSMQDGCYVKACAKGQSCRCTFRWLTLFMYVMGWTYADVENFALDPNYVAFAWLQVRDDPDAVLRARWAELLKSDLKPYKTDPRTQKSKRRKRGSAGHTASPSGSSAPFSYQDATARKLLRVMKDNPGKGKRFYRREMAQRGWKHGTTDFYLTECTERGHLIHEVAEKVGLADGYFLDSAAHVRFLSDKHLHPEAATSLAGVPEADSSTHALDVPQSGLLAHPGIGTPLEGEEGQKHSSIGTPSAPAETAHDEHLGDVIKLPKPAPVEPMEPGTYRLARTKWHVDQEQPAKPPEDAEEVDGSGVPIPWWRTQGKFSEEEITFTTERSWSHHVWNL